MEINHQFRLAARPVGLPKRSDWQYTEEPVRELADGELLVKILYISLDPAMRGWRYVGIDLDPAMLDEGRPRIHELGLDDTIEMRVGDALALPFDDGTLTMAVGRATLHHLPDKALSLTEMYRVLEPGGIALVHDMRRDAPQHLLDRFTEMRAAADYPPTHVEEKITLDEAHALVAEAGLAEVASIYSPSMGLGALGFEILLKKPALA